MYDISFDTIRAEGFRSQVVAGTIYMVKYFAYAEGRDYFLIARIFEALPFDDQFGP